MIVSTCLSGTQVHSNANRPQPAHVNGTGDCLFATVLLSVRCKHTYVTCVVQVHAALACVVLYFHPLVPCCLGCLLPTCARMCICVVLLCCRGAQGIIFGEQLKQPSVLFRVLFAPLLAQSNSSQGQAAVLEGHAQLHLSASATPIPNNAVLS